MKKEIKIKGKKTTVNVLDSCLVKPRKKYIHTCGNTNCIMHGCKFHKNRKKCWICSCKAKIFRDYNNENNIS